MGKGKRERWVAQIQVKGHPRVDPEIRNTSTLPLHVFVDRLRVMSHTSVPSILDSQLLILKEKTMDGTSPP